MGNVIPFPTQQHRWELKFKTPVKFKLSGALPFMLEFEDQFCVAWVDADTLQQARFIVSQQIPISEWLD